MGSLKERKWAGFFFDYHRGKASGVVSVTFWRKVRRAVAKIKIHFVLDILNSLLRVLRWAEVCLEVLLRCLAALLMLSQVNFFLGLDVTHVKDWNWELFLWTTSGVLVLSSGILKLTDFLKHYNSFLITRLANLFYPDVFRFFTHMNFIVNLLQQALYLFINFTANICVHTSNQSSFLLLFLAFFWSFEDPPCCQHFVAQF